MIRAAIVGTGAVAASHARAIVAHADRTTLVAAVDTDRSRLDPFIGEHRVPAAYTDVRQMLDRERPDVVHVCTPPRAHAGIAVTSLDAGAWVFCEKPICASLAELDRIAAAEERTGRYCASVFQLRFGSAAQRLAAEIRGGQLGRPLLALCESTLYRDAAYYEDPWRGRWETALGGTTINLGIHAMDLLLFLLGDWDDVRAVAATIDRPIDIEDVSLAHVRFKSGALASIVNSVLSPRERTYLRIDFQKATVEACYLGTYREADWRYRWVGAAPDPIHGPEVLPSHEAQLSSFLDSMQRGERPAVSGDDARRTLELVTAIYKSAADSAPVGRGSIRPGDPFYDRAYGVLPERIERRETAPF